MVKEEKALKAATQYIDNWLSFLIESDPAPGISVSIKYRGRSILENAYGFANHKENEKLTTEHIFHIASHSKMFTATALAQLQEKSQIDFDDLVIKYLPWLEEHTDNRWRNVTIRQLMGHYAGVRRDGYKYGDFWSLHTPFPNKDNLIKDILSSKLVFETNTQMKYSNIGYGVLGLIIESVTKLNYSQYIEKNILKPLRLKSTYADFNPKISKLATGYTGLYKGKRIPFEKGVSANALASATGVCSTAEDLTTFTSALMKGTDQLIGDETKKELQKTHDLSNGEGSRYGLGFESTNNRKDWVGHGGGYPGFITRTLFNDNKKISISVLTNRDGGPAYALAHGIIDVIEWFMKNYTKTHKDSAKYGGTFGNIKEPGFALCIVATDKKIMRTYLGGFRPLKNAKELHKTASDNLKVDDNDYNFSSPGEILEYKRKGGQIVEILYGGCYYIPINQARKSWNKIEKKGFINKAT